MLKRDAFGNLLIIKRTIIFYVGLIIYYRFNIANKTKVKGSEVLRNLPENGVLFVSNHQTYFADVAGMYQVFNHAKIGVYNRIDVFKTLFFPRLNVYFVAARETMKSGFLPRLFSYVGAVMVKRTWRAKGKDVERPVDPTDVDNIHRAIHNGWVITFPQGTTKPYVQGRKGTAHLIKETRPIVIPVVVNGFRRAFDKKGFFMKKKNVELTITFKEPMKLDYEDSADDILRKVMLAIEQTEEHAWFPPEEEPTI